MTSDRAHCTICELDFDTVKVFNNYTYKIPGFRREAASTKGFGMSYQDHVDSYHCFTLVSFYDGNTVLIEIGIHDFEDGNNMTKFGQIDPEWFKGFMKDNPYGKFLVERDGRVFISGFADWTDCVNVTRIGKTALLGTNAMEFLEDYGNILATALAFQSTVKTSTDAADVYEMINDVLYFKDEVGSNGYGIITSKIRKLKKDIEEQKSYLANIDRKMNEDYRRYAGYIDTLTRLGIDCKRFAIEGEKTIQASQIVV